MMQTHLFLADLHTGSSVALCPRNPHLDGGAGHTLSPGQGTLLHHWDEIVEMAEKAPDPLYVHLVGDIMETDMKNRTNQLVTRNIANITGMATELIEPLAKKAKGLFFYRGTEAHGGKSSEHEENLAKDFDNTIKCPETGDYTWYENLLVSEGVTMLIQHHPPAGGGGGRPQNEYSLADRIAVDIMHVYSQQHREPPDLFIGAHLHRYKDSFSHFRTRAIILPCFSLHTSHNKRHGIMQLSTIGGVFIQTSNGQYKAWPIFHELGRLDKYECV